jgi:prepilin-type N-terminal cleavage/methylation domain-containing protein
MIKNKKGFSIIEILVVISIFAVIGVLTTSAVSLTLRGGKKSDSLVRVRENVNYSLAVIERQIRNSDVITTCTGSPTSTISYTSLEGISTSFSCVTPGTSGYIASGSARLTSTDISITSCSFTCTQIDANNPPSIRVSVSAEDATSTSTEKGTISTEMEIVTRNY